MTTAGVSLNIFAKNQIYLNNVITNKLMHEQIQLHLTSYRKIIKILLSLPLQCMLS